MPSASSRRRVPQASYWPGFVDALAALLMVVVFLVMVFAVAQFFLSDALSGRDQALDRLTRQVDELARMLSLERDANADLRLSVSQLSAQLQGSISERDALVAKLSEAEEALESEKQRTQERLSSLRETVAADKETIELQLRDLERLRRDIEALRQVREGLEAEIAKVTGELGAQRDLTKELQARLADQEERTQLAQEEVEKRDVRLRELLQRAEVAEESFSQERETRQRAQDQVALLNRQLEELRRQIAALNDALDASEAKNEEQEIEIVNLGQRLNAALATKVQELARYRSEFFGRLRQVLGDRSDIRIVGDRFVFQSELLFPTAEAVLNEQGRDELQRFADTLKEVAAQIPDDIDWILRVDGHTDRRPINNERFASNWELSTARAISVVKFLVEQGVPPPRLVAAGFGEYQPIDSGNDEIALRRNRRIEFKLDQR